MSAKNFKVIYYIAKIFYKCDAQIDKIFDICDAQIHKIFDDAANVWFEIWI